MISPYGNAVHSSPSPPSLPSPFRVEVGARWSELIHFNWQVPVALCPGYVQWVMHEGPPWFGFQWEMTLSGANGVSVTSVTLSVCVCVWFAHTCICSPHLTSNGHWQSQMSIRWQLTCQCLFMDSFGFGRALQLAGVTNNGNTTLCLWKSSVSTL